MKPPKTILAVMGLSLLIAGAAGAGGWDHRDHGHGGDHGGRREQAMEPRGQGGGHGEHGFVDRAPGREAFAPRGYARPSYPAYAPGYAPPARNWNRGQFLPHDYWTGQSVDPRSHRLRTPPPGYGWYGVGRDAYLVQRSTGLILDTAPGGW